MVSDRSIARSAFAGFFPWKFRDREVPRRSFFVDRVRYPHLNRRQRRSKNLPAESTVQQALFSTERFTMMDVGSGLRR